jgi:predicted Zn-dependent peptidase
MTPGFSSTNVQRYAAGVLGWILGDGENSRLYWALVDNGLCDEASFDHTSEDGLGHFGGYISTDPDRAKEALAIYKNILEEAQKNGVTLEELERAKRKVAVSIVLRAETPYSRLFSMSMEYLDTLEYKPLADVVKTVQSVTLEEVNAILETRPFDAMTVVGLMPDGFKL